MKIFTLTTFLAIIACTGAFGQLSGASHAENAIYVEAGGNGLFYSVNYERELTESTALRVGGSLAGSQYRDILATWTYFVGSGSSRIEIGGGPILLHTTERFTRLDFDKTKPSTDLLLTGTLAYRYQERDGGFLFRAAFTPIVNPGFNGESITGILWGGVSLGWGF